VVIVCLLVSKTILGKKKKNRLQAHACNPSTWEAEAKGSQVQGWPGLEHSDTLSQEIQPKE
jgi:hypothetical protein